MLPLHPRDMSVAGDPKLTGTATICGPCGQSPPTGRLTVITLSGPRKLRPCSAFARSVMIARGAPQAPLTRSSLALPGVAGPGNKMHRYTWSGDDERARHMARSQGPPAVQKHRPKERCSEAPRHPSRLICCADRCTYRAADQRLRVKELVRHVDPPLLPSGPDPAVERDAPHGRRA